MSVILKRQLVFSLPAIILLLTLVLELSNSDNEISYSEGGQKSPALRKPLTFSLPPLDQAFTAIRDRPINLPNRRQPPGLPRGSSTTKSSTQIGKFELIGVAITEERNIALIREVSNGKMHSIEVGEKVNGMQLEKVESTKITFSKGVTTEELVLKAETKK